MQLYGWTDGQIDTRKLIVAFHNVANVPKAGENLIFLASNLPHSVH